MNVRKGACGTAAERLVVPPKAPLFGICAWYQEKCALRTKHVPLSLRGSDFAGHNAGWSRVLQATAYPLGKQIVGLARTGAPPVPPYPGQCLGSISCWSSQLDILHRATREEGSRSGSTRARAHLFQVLYRSSPNCKS